MTDTVPAAATGLPSFDRRSFLSTLIAAGVLSAGTDLPAAASAEHPDAELVELEAVLAAAEARRNDFYRQLDEAVDRYVMPEIPEALYWRDSDFPCVWIDRKGRLAQYGQGDDARWVYEDKREIDSLRESLSAYRASNIANGKFRTSNRTLGRIEEILAASAAWKAAIKIAEDRAGCTEPEAAAERESQIIDDLRLRIVSISAKTWDGVAAKARAASTSWSSTFDTLAAVVLPRLLASNLMSGDDCGDLWAVSIIVDAMTIGAPASVVTKSARVAA